MRLLMFFKLKIVVCSQIQDEVIILKIKKDNIMHNIQIFKKHYSLMKHFDICNFYLQYCYFMFSISYTLHYLYT